MNFLQGLDGSSGLLIAVCGVLLCVGGIVLIFGVQLLGGLLNTLFGFVELFFNILAGGPVAWCGCLVFLFGCILCAALVLGILSILPTCGTEDAINLCRFLGR